ncbi:hypothetical protein TNCV_170181 [Trichonephila clavipes]|nr:hypothetical protein TNCV_170181 [Trichonephila clavipes]
MNPSLNNQNTVETTSFQRLNFNIFNENMKNYITLLSKKRQRVIPSKIRIGSEKEDSGAFRDERDFKLSKTIKEQLSSDLECFFLFEILDNEITAGTEPAAKGRTISSSMCAFLPRNNGKKQRMAGDLFFDAQLSTQEELKKEIKEER